MFIIQKTYSLINSKKHTRTRMTDTRNIKRQRISSGDSSDDDNKNNEVKGGISGTVAAKLRYVVEQAMPRIKSIPDVLAEQIYSFMQVSHRPPVIPRGACERLYDSILPGGGRVPVVNPELLASQFSPQVLVSSDVEHVLKFMFRYAGVVQSLDEVMMEFAYRFLYQYRNSILIKFSYRPRYGSVWRSNELWSKRQFRDVNGNVEVYLGSISGKHSEVTATLSEMIDDEIDDPKEIYRLVVLGQLPIDNTINEQLANRGHIKDESEYSDEDDDGDGKGEKEEEEENKREEEEKEDGDERDTSKGDGTTCHSCGGLSGLVTYRGKCPECWS